MTSVLRKLAPPPASDRLAEYRDGAVEAAQQLVYRVRTDDPRRVWAHLQDLHPTQLLAMAIALAAMVPDDRTVGELLAWTDGLEEIA